MACLCNLGALPPFPGYLVNPAHLPFFQSQGRLRHANFRMRWIKKTLSGANPIEIIAESQLIIALTTMKFLLFIAFAAGLLILERESFLAKLH